MLYRSSWQPRSFARHGGERGAPPRRDEGEAAPHSRDSVAPHRSAQQQQRGETEAPAPSRRRSSVVVPAQYNTDNSDT